jgi:hypothetical protein
LQEALVRYFSCLEGRPQQFRDLLIIAVRGVLVVSRVLWRCLSNLAVLDRVLGGVLVLKRAVL